MPAPDGPTHEHTAIRRRYAFDRLTQLSNGCRAADECGWLRRKLLELLDLALEAGIFQCAVGNQNQAVSLKWLLDEVVCAVLDGGDRRLDVTVTRDHHDRKFGVLLLHAVEQLQTIKLAALQPDVQEDQVRSTGCDRRQGIIAVAGGTRSVALVLEDAGNQIADIGLVIDYQDFVGHGATR